MPGQSESIKETLARWIAVSIELVAEDPTVDPDRLHHDEMATSLWEAIRKHDPAPSARMVLDAPWAASHLARILGRFGLRADGDEWSGPTGLVVRPYLDAPRGRAYVEAFGSEVAAPFLVTLAPACTFHSALSLVFVARRAATDDALALAIWQLGAAGRKPGTEEYVLELFQRYEGRDGPLGEAVQAARALYMRHPELEDPYR